MIFLNYKVCYTSRKSNTQKSPPRTGGFVRVNTIQKDLVRFS